MRKDRVVMIEGSSIGLDVGNCHINMVKLIRDSESLTLADYASLGLDPAQGQAHVVEQLRKLVSEKEISDSSINIGVSGDSVIVRYLDLPKMEKKELDQALRYEAQQYIPFKMEEVLFDYHLIEGLDQTKDKIKVLLVAAKKEVVMDFVQLLGEIGLKAHLIDVNSFALINCFQANGPKEEDVVALVNLGFSLVNINILQGEMPFFTRDISLSSDIIALYHNKMQQPEQPIEEIKPLLTNLIREIQLSIDYFESEFEKQVNKIYVSGEGARSAGLINLFNMQLDKEVLSWNTLQGLSIDSTKVNVDELNKVSPMLALACGLALRR